METKTAPAGGKSLIGLNSAASQLGISRNSVQRHFHTVRVGGRVLVRAADIEDKITEGRTDGH